MSENVIFDPEKMKNFGMMTSPWDPRDFRYAAVVPDYKASLPRKFVRENVTIKDQGKEGTCVGFSGSYIKEAQEMKNHPTAGLRFSPRYLYEHCKKIDNAPQTEGTYPSVAMSVLKNRGICLEESLPYVSGQRDQPDTADEQEAADFKISAYARAQSLDEIKAALIQQGPLMAGVLVTDSFVEAPKGFIPTLVNGYLRGGHAIALWDFDDDMTHTYPNGRVEKGFIRFPNSWGTGWGDQGWGYLPYSFVTQRLDIGMPLFQESWSAMDVITPTKTTEEIILWIGKDIAYVNGTKVILEQPPEINPLTGRTIVPLRFIAEHFGADVKWDSVTKKITIRKKK